MTEKSSWLKTWSDHKGVPEEQQIYEAGFHNGLKLGKSEKAPDGFAEGAQVVLDQYKTKWGIELGRQIGDTIERAFQPLPFVNQEEQEKGPSVRERAGKATKVAGRVARVAWNIYRNRKNVPTSTSTEIVSDDNVIEAEFVNK